MRKVLKFKNWFTLSEAAHHLSLLLDDDVQVADILQLAVDLKLKLSVNFLRAVTVLKVSVIPKNDETPPFEYLVTEDKVDKDHNPPYHFQFYDNSEVEVFDGICNVVMMFGGLYTVKQSIYALSNGLIDIDNPVKSILLEKSGAFYLLLDGTDQDGPTIKMEAVGVEYSLPVFKHELKGLNAHKNFTFASFLPLKSEFIVTKNSLEEFVFENVQPDMTSNDRPLNVRIENNYLRLIKELALLIKGVNLNIPNQAAQLIIDSTDIKLSSETISKYLRKANELDSGEFE